jgi:hypothetical protein
MKWRNLVGRTIVGVAATRAGEPDEEMPNVLHLRFADGSGAMICCDWASHERPWLDLEQVSEGDDPWMPGPEAPAPSV